MAGLEPVVLHSLAANHSLDIRQQLRHQVTVSWCRCDD